ncbi:hypothetical protein TRVA0_006S02938 [Trichomonascus vanleenenianus]|uniref:uncharacterized protein n=1 Tax=Trichomonascus vanleenenianus TaxID=2268995 RepID=UPI003ECB18ED
MVPIRMFPKPPSKAHGWPSYEEMIKYFTDVRQQVDGQYNALRMEVTRRPHPQAQAVLERRAREAYWHFNQVIKHYEMTREVNAKSPEYSSRMRRFYSEMTDHFTKAVEQLNESAARREIYGR